MIYSFLFAYYTSIIRREEQDNDAHHHHFSSVFTGNPSHVIREEEKIALRVEKE